jgi:hypothetical protein
MNFRLPEGDGNELGESFTRKDFQTIKRRRMFWLLSGLYPVYSGIPLGM